MLTAGQVYAAVDQVLSSRFGGEFERADVRFAEDHSGEHALFIKVRFRRGSPISSGPILNRAATELRLTLLDAGGERFPYVDAHYPLDGETLVDESR